MVGKNPIRTLAVVSIALVALSFAQAASAIAQVPGEAEHSEHAFSPTGLIEPMGIVTLLLVASTVCLGVLRRLKPRPLLTIHKICGVCALSSGAIHAILVFIAHSH